MLNLVKSAGSLRLRTPNETVQIVRTIIFRRAKNGAKVLKMLVKWRVVCEINCLIRYDINKQKQISRIKVIYTI